MKPLVAAMAIVAKCHSALERPKKGKKLRKTKQRLKHRFWTEIYSGAKFFYLYGLQYGK